MTSSTTGSVTGSPESEDGFSPFCGRGGIQQNPSGPVHARVSRFRSPESEREHPTRDICGPLFGGSSRSTSLQLSLENRLREELATSGLQPYELTWKSLAIGLRPPICQLQLLAHRMRDRGFSLWATPTARDWKSDKGSKDWDERKHKETRGKPLPWQVGALLPGSYVKTGRRGLLHPEFARWMMGFPTGWGKCAVTEMPSSRNSQPSSSGLT